jgi:hypothetical protein
MGPQSRVNPVTERKMCQISFRSMTNSEEKITVAHMVKQFPASYGNQRVHHRVHWTPSEPAESTKRVFLSSVIF